MLVELRKLFKTKYRMGDMDARMFRSEPTYKFRFMLADDKEIELNVVMYEDLSFIPKKVYMFEDRSTLITLKFTEKLYLMFKIFKEIRKKKRFKKNSVRNKLTSFINENVPDKGHFNPEAFETEPGPPTITPSKKSLFVNLIKDPRKLFT